MLYNAGRCRVDMFLFSVKFWFWFVVVSLALYAGQVWMTNKFDMNAVLKEKRKESFKDAVEEDIEDVNAESLKEK